MAYLSLDFLCLYDRSGHIDTNLNVLLQWKEMFYANKPHGEDNIGLFNTDKIDVINCIFVSYN